MLLKNIYSSSLLRAKIKAALIHLSITATLAVLVVLAVNHFWFPYGTLRFLKGWEIFLVLIACDIVLGPALSLVIFNQNKQRRERIIDYSVIAAVQLAALFYGLHMLSQNRLAFLVYTVDRYEAVSAGDLSKEEMAKAPNPKWRNLSYVENYVVAVQPPDATQADFFSMVFSGLEDKDLQFFPSLYRELDTVHPPIRDRIQSIDALSPQAQDVLRSVISKLNIKNQNNVGWLPLSRERVFWTMLVDKNTGKPIHALAIDPYLNGA